MVDPIVAEEWRPVPGYEGRYEVSDFGAIRSPNRPHKTLKTRKNPQGYPALRLYKDGKYRTMSVHRAVAKAFIPNPQCKPQVNHKNGVRHDSRLENLEWCTQSENIQHSMKMFGSGYGERHTQAKLNSELVLEILSLRGSGESLRSIGRRYGIDNTTVHNIWIGKTWWRLTGASRRLRRQPRKELAQ